MTLELDVRVGDFVAQSNAIEGILRPATPAEVQVHQQFLGLQAVAVGDLQRFVDVIAGAVLRDREGLDVRVGSYVPPAGGTRVRRELASLVRCANQGNWTPYELHLAYEALHPFTDGNGRSGRVLWAWMTARTGGDPFALPFLHAWYYDSLNASRIP